MFGDCNGDVVYRGGCVWNEPLVEIQRPEKMLQLFLRVQLRSLPYGQDAVLVRSQASCVDDMPEKCESVRGENALAWVNGYSEFFEPVEDHANVFDVLFRIIGRDKYVIDVSKNEIEAGENGIDQPLECLCGVTETKAHHWKFKQPERSSDGGVMYVVGGDGNFR